MQYNHKELEPKWQKYWDEKKVFSSEADPSKPKYYVLDMFPYPSGAGLHVGHAEGYTATDIVARYKRKMGFNVLHPMGWDSFGLPAEQYAVRTGTHPADTTKKNIATFKKQLKAMGFSYDWDREIATSDADYYKWTQWIFTKLFDMGLAYEADMLVNYCPQLGTVLANEEVENGRAKEGGYPVERRPLKQWILKITAYADRLLDDLELVDWPDSLKRLQRNWIGKSEGAHISFAIAGQTESITVFTTRQDTLFGSTYLVLAPEHALIHTITTPAQKRVVEDYQLKTAQKSDLDRTDLAKDKTGVFTGAHAIHPLTQEKLPIWISDYVLMGYGTGAVMAVPAHDDRDFEFATTFDLPIRPVIRPDVEGYPELIPIEVDASELLSQVLAGKTCWSGPGKCINSQSGDFSINGLAVEGAKGRMTRHLEQIGAGKKAINYKLRDWLFSRQRYWGEPFPILHFEDGTKRALALDELPLTPPPIRDYKPSGDGRSPLAKVPEWVEIDDPKTGKKALRETNTMPQWAGSCWYYLRFLDPHNTTAAFAKEKEQYWMPVDLYVGGVEHAVLHLLYARFWHKVLYDCSLVSTLEPFQKLRNQGLIVARSFKKEGGGYVAPEEVVQDHEGNSSDKKTGERLIVQVEKMSKSKLNGVTPDDVVAEFGADSLRLYEMFMGPLEKEKIWNTDSVSGCRRFLSRFFDLVTSEKLSDAPNEKGMQIAHRTVAKVLSDVENLSFNTAIARMMEFVNEMNKLDHYPRAALLMVTNVLNPFAPHISEELWQILGGQGELTHTPFPQVEEKYLHDETITYVVQINGKLRGRFDLPKDQDKDSILESALNHPHIGKFVAGKKIERVIYVPNKLLNLVVSGE